MKILATIKWLWGIAITAGVLYLLFVPKVFGAQFNIEEPSYASLSEYTFADTTGSTTTLTLQDTHYAWKGASSTISNMSGRNTASTTIVSGTSTITVGPNGAGIYEVSMGLSIAVDQPNQTIHCQMFKNGTGIFRASAETRITTANDQKQMAGGPAFLYLNAGDSLYIGCENHTSAGTVLTFNLVNWGIHRL